MEKIRPILYGVADYAQLRKKNAWFVDRTAKIRDLEDIAYAVFLRPRRFGKSLLTSILEAYYDVRYADRFDEFFAGTDIGANPTDERGKYLVLKFDFSAVSKDARQVQDSFNKYAADCCDADIKAKAIDQLDRYSADQALVAKWHLGRSNETGDALPPGRRQDGGSPYGEPPSRRLTGTTDVSSVALQRLVLVFHGGECMLSEEV